MCGSHRLGVILDRIEDGDIWGPDPLWTTVIRSVSEVDCTFENVPKRGTEEY